MGGYVYMNGTMAPEDEARVSVFDMGFNYGDGLFETMKARGAEVLFLKEHLIRLKEGAGAIGIPPGPLKGLYADIRRGAIRDLLKKNGLGNALSYIKIIVTRGNGDAPVPGAPVRPTTVIVCKPIDEKTVSRRQKAGVKAVVVKDFRPAIPWVKSLNYLPNILARAEAERKGAYEAIFTGADSSLLEGTSTNLFLVEGGRVKTPPVLSRGAVGGVLPGIMRGKVMELALKEGIRVIESPLYVEDLAKAEEAFLTNSIVDIVPLLSVDSRPVGSGKAGPVTRILQERLKCYTESDAWRRDCRGTQPS